MPGIMLPLPEEEEESDGVCWTQQHIGEDPSSSKLQCVEFILPDLCLEEVAIRVSLDAVREGGRIAAAPALTTFFQVCSDWQKICLSEHLWRELIFRIWLGTPRRHCVCHSWRDEFKSFHQRALNFHYGRYTHTESFSINLRYSNRLVLSEQYLVAGSIRGAVHVYSLPSLKLVATHTLSSDITGLILMGNRLVFASEDGDIHITHIGVCENYHAHVRLVRAGSRWVDGVLVDFIGDGHQWIGLFGKLRGFSWRVWDGETEQEVYAGDFIANGMHIRPLNGDLELKIAARIRMVREGLILMGTRSYAWLMRVGPTMEVIAEMYIGYHSVDTMSANNNKIMIAYSKESVASVREAETLEEVGRFDMMERSLVDKRFYQAWGVGCMNTQVYIMWEYEKCGGVWDLDSERYLYALKPTLESITGAVANERYVAACTLSYIHLWDFGGM